jgi:type VI secretion system secreted protein VgrG
MCFFRRRIQMKRRWLTVSILGILAQFFSSSMALAQLSSFTVLGGSTVTNTAPTIVNGNLGVSPGSAVTGFPPGMVTGGSIHAADSVAAQAQTDLTTLYNQLAATPCTTDLTGQDLGGLILTPGVYCFNTSAQLTGILTLNGLNNPNANFVFKMGSTLTTTSGSSVLLINNASSCGVGWQVGSSATLGTGTSLLGNIVALTSITLNTGASVAGRLLARNGAVTLDNNQVTFCSGSTGLPGLPPPIQLGAPAMSLPALAGLALLLAALGSVLVRKARAW